MFRKISWELIFTYILVIVFSMALLGMFLLNFIDAYFTENTRQDLYRQAQLLAEGWPRSVKMQGPTSREVHFYWKTIDRISNQTGYRIRVLTDRGIPLYDTGGEPEPQISINPEVTKALSGKSAQGKDNDGFSQAYPVIDYGISGNQRKVIGVIYLSRSKIYLQSILSYVKGQFYMGFFISLIVSLTLALMLSHYITKPITDLTRQTDLIARGNLNQNVHVNTQNELGILSEKFNIMAKKLQGTMSQLIEEKNKLESIINSIASGVLVIDDESKIIVINKMALSLLGIRKHNILGKKISTTIPGHLLLQLIEDSEMTKEVRETLEDMHEGKAIDAYVTPLTSHKERPLGLVVILNDVTEFKRLDRMRTEFVSNVSHELKTPLASIKGLSELLIDGALKDECAINFLNSINREVDRLTRLVKDLLDLSKMESGMIKFEVHPFYINESIEQVLIRLTPQASKKEITIQKIFQSNPLVLANIDRVQQVLINLLDNAIRYSTNKSKITISTNCINSFCKIEIEDTGPGISEAHMERIFERFYRADRSRSRDEGGFGLGLAISQQIIENMGGSIGVRSTPPKGTTFHFTLPLKKV